MAAGLVIENLSVAQGDALRTAVRQAAPPVLVVFFVAVGASLRLDAVAATRSWSSRWWCCGSRRSGWAWLAGLRISGIDPEPARHVWTGLVSQAGITLGFAAVAANEFGGWATQVQVLLVGAIAINELVGPVVFRRGLSHAGDLDAPPPRPLFVVSNREPYLHVRQPDGAMAVNAATGGVAVALDALMRERGGVWVAHGAGDADARWWTRRTACACRPTSPPTRCGGSGSTTPTFAAYYGGYANEGLWPLCHQVDVRPQFRGEDWTAYRQVNEAFAGGHRSRARRSGRAGLHPGLPPGARRAGPARAPARGADRALLAHPVALSGPAAHLPAAARDPGGPAGQRPAWRSRWSATGATS